MKKWLQKILNAYKAQKNLRLIVLAAVILQVILAIQHFYVHYLLEMDLERDAERELIMKAILIKGILNTNEQALISQKWSVLQNLHNPDSVFNAGKWLVKSSTHLQGAGIGFIPYYYPQKGRLYELYVQKTEGELTIRQIASDGHDYTKMEFYSKSLSQNRPLWSDPYVDTVGNGLLISTFSLPILEHGKPVGIMAIDMSLEWMNDTIGKRHIHPSSFNLLLTEGGKPIVQPAETDEKAHDIEQVARLINDSTVHRKKSSTRISTFIDFKSDTDGSKGRIYYANMKGNPHWQLVLVNYDDEVYGKLNWMTLNIFVLMLITLGILSYIIWHYAQNERKLQQTSLEQERISSELRIASAIQQAMQPKGTVTDPLEHNVDVSGLLLPAREVGGDLFDCFIRDEKLYFCIGDVSGKGVPSALFMAVTQALFHASINSSKQPVQIMRSINQTICHNNYRSMFITFFLGVLDLPTGRLRYCNAGHNAPILISTEPHALHVKPNLPLGVMDDFKFEEQECLLHSGDTLFLYTDGLNEAMNQERQQFGMLRVLDCLSQSKEQVDNCQQLLQRMVDKVHQFTGTAQQSDDLTMLTIHYTPKTEHDLLSKSIVLQNDVKQVGVLNSFVDDIAQELNLEPTIRQQVKLAVEEAVVNVMEYAFPKGKTGDITVEVRYNHKLIKFVITDMGIPFDPTETARADTTLSVDERPIGGLGIFLVRQLMDTINYERIEGKNILTLRKNYNNQT